MIKKTICIMFLTILLIFGGGYAVMVNVPISSPSKDKVYYTYVKTTPSFRDKKALLEYCKSKRFNTHYCIFVNYSIQSGNSRFFIYDFEKQEIIYKCRCAHGLGGGSTARKPVFSNSYGSLCSSLGKFVISGVGSANFRNSFRVKGLDESNSNAARRGILIHAGRNVTRHKLLPWMLLSKTSEGCLTITKEGLSKLHDIYNSENNKRILIYSYNEK